MLRTVLLPSLYKMFICLISALISSMTFISTNLTPSLACHLKSSLLSPVLPSGLTSTRVLITNKMPGQLAFDLSFVVLPHFLPHCQIFRVRRVYLSHTGNPSKLTDLCSRTCVLVSSIKCHAFKVFCIEFISFTFISIISFTILTPASLLLVSLFHPHNKPCFFLFPDPAAI